MLKLFLVIGAIREDPVLGCDAFLKFQRFEVKAIMWGVAAHGHGRRMCSCCSLRFIQKFTACLLLDDQFLLRRMQLKFLITSLIIELWRGAEAVLIEITPYLCLVLTVRQRFGNQVATRVLWLTPALELAHRHIIPEGTIAMLFGRLTDLFLRSRWANMMIPTIDLNLSDLVYQ